MRFDIITIFPDLVMDAIHQSIPGRAIKTGLAEVVAHDLRDYTEDKHKTGDDTP